MICDVGPVRPARGRMWAPTFGPAGGADGIESAKKELRDIEAAKATLEARLGELDAKIGFQKKAVYDADVIQATLQRFARFIYRLPPEMQARMMCLLFKQVRVYKDRITAELHELPIADLPRFLDLKVAFLRTNALWRHKRRGGDVMVGIRVRMRLAKKRA